MNKLTVLVRAIVRAMLLCMLFSCVPLFAQRQNSLWTIVGAGASVPGSCSGHTIFIYTTDGSYRYCNGSTFINPFSGGGGIGTLNTLTDVTQTFAKTNDTNVTLTITSSSPTHTFALGWAGTLAAGRLNSNVVQGITNDTNVTGSISAQNLTIGWTSTLAAGRLNANVVQGVTNDTNVTGSISAQNLTFGWAGTLAITRGGTGQGTAAGAFNALSPMTTLGDLIYGGSSGAGTRLAGDTSNTRKFIRTLSSGGVATAPAWDILTANDYPTMVGDAGSGGTKGAVPAPASGDAAANKFLKADATWAVPPGGGTGCTTSGSGLQKGDGAGGCSSATGHDVASILTCVAGSASGTAYTCSTSPTFTPSSGDLVLFNADVANTGSATLNVNSTAAKTIKKQGGGTNLAANDLLLGQYVTLLYDGTNWQMQGQTGNAAGGSGGPSVSSDTYANIPGTCTHTSTQSDIFYATDFPYAMYTKYLCTATNTWTPYLGNVQVTQAPSAGGFTLINGTGASITTTSGGVLQFTTGSTNNWQAAYVAAPSTPYHVTVALVVSSSDATVSAQGGSSDECGLAWTTAASGFQAFELQPGYGIGASNVNNNGTGNSNLFGSGDNFVNPPLGPGGIYWFDLYDDGSTDRYLKYTQDNSSFPTIYKQSRTNFITPIGVGVQCNGPSMTLSVLYWKAH